MGRHKYHARRTTVCGCTFPSRAEAARWVQLKVALEAGEIRDLERQVPYQLEDCKYFADFRYYRAFGCVPCSAYVLVVEDVKGRDTPMSRLKRKGVLRRYGVKVEIVKMRTKDVNLLLAAAGGRDASG